MGLADAVVERLADGDRIAVLVLVEGVEDLQDFDAQLASIEHVREEGATKVLP